MTEDTFAAGDVTLHRVREHVWEIEQTGEMEVPARVLASESLLEEISDDRTLEQIQYVAHLPGIQTNAICMPDGHQGYGFPVGGVAATDAEEGCISPGGVGYDINCLTGDSSVRLSFGRRRSVADLAGEFEDTSVVVPDDGETGVSGEETAGVRLFTESGEQTVYELETATGQTLRATGDHEIRTAEGMRELADVRVGDTVYVSQFDGLPADEPEDFVVLDESDFSEQDPQLVAFLKRNDLLPLRSTDDAFNRLLKLVGFHTGDGSFTGTQTWFYADEEDLEDIRADVAALGFSPSRVYERDLEQEIDGNSFERTAYSVKVAAHGFKQLLCKLGAPDGPTVESAFTTPAYLDRLADWQRALYLSAFFGAEMSAPAAQTDTARYCPTVSQTRHTSVADAGEQFFREVASHLEDLGVETNQVERFDGTADDVERLRVGIKNDSENLCRFLSTVGYRYNREKRRRAVAATTYLRLKERQIRRRADIAPEARSMADGGTSVAEVKRALDSNDRFVERSIYSGRDGPPRPGPDFPSFEEFEAAVTVGEDFTVPVSVESISESGTEPVYDVGVDHDAHAFVADGLVVSNCGVRMVRTDLTYDDVRGREEELVDALFDAVPSGLGGGGVVERDVETVEAILADGVEWAVEEGYAVPADLEHCEDEGRRPEADPSVVSAEAKERGATQIGSLGSGNHFLEVQRVTDVYREDVAREFGLEADQLVVLIHCGSRGLGHQVCTDYLRAIEQEHEDLLESLPDRELAAAPAGSQLAAEYYRAMCAAINFAWVNRQLVTHQTRQVFADVFDAGWEDLGMDLLYDVAHNIAKREVHEVEGTERELFVHRKGATRAFPAGREEVPPAYRDVGQPVIIPGSMGAGSYVLRGGARSLGETFGSTAHGAGRRMSRTQAKRDYWGGDVQDRLRDQDHVYVKAQSGATIAEEAPEVYKDVDEVVRVSDALGIGDRVARTFPVCNIKG
ncbi:MAG: RtcB family protein [Halobacteriaceae archaeon]